MLKTIVKTVTALSLGTILVGCVDVDVDIALLSDTTAKATMTQVMNADFYTLTKLNAAEAGADEEPAFCAEGDLTESVDGSATCVLVEQGAFADLDLGQEEGGVTFTAAGPGLVRMALSTASLEAEASIEDELDAETRELIDAFFIGRTMTVSFSGAEVIETNMDLAADGNSASKSILLLDLMNGTADLPNELFAVVRAP